MVDSRGIYDREDFRRIFPNPDKPEPNRLRSCPESDN